MLEFTFVAIPLMFVMISIFEISRGIWVYNSLAHGVKEATRFAIVHGNNCAISPNNCVVTAAQICQVLHNSAPGLEAGRIRNVTMTSTTRTLGPFTDISSCAGSATVFPSKPWGSNVADVGGSQGQPVEIRASYQFVSALAFFWTGQSGFTFGEFFLSASAQERVQY